MSWITDTNENTYWMPEVLPEKTIEWQTLQEQKFYLTPQETERIHPKWTYDQNNAYVDDDYLFYNEGWKLIIDDRPEEQYLKIKVRNQPSEWEEIDEKTVKVTYTFVDYSQEQVEELVGKKWIYLREKRDSLLVSTDWIFIRAQEQNLKVSGEVITYRQQLRDLPSTITNMVEFNNDDDSLWPIKPVTFFEV